MEKSEFLSLRGFSRYMGSSAATVNRWLKEGMPHIQPNGYRGRCFIEVDKAVAWLREQSDLKKKEGLA